MKKVLIQFKNLGKDLKNLNIDIVADAVDSQPLFNNPLSIESFKLTGQGLERQISERATKLYLIPQYHEYFISGGNPSISEISQLKFTNVRGTTFLNNHLYTAEISDQNYLSEYILWKSGSTPRFNLTNSDPLVNGGIFTKGYTGSSITGQFIGVGSGYSGTTINVVEQKNNKLKVYNTPGISGFGGTYSSGIYNINNTLRSGFKNDQNLIGTGGGFFIFKNTSPNEWRAVELNSGGSIVETWYRNSGSDTFGYYNFIPPVTGWRLGQNTNQRFNPVPETYFGTCNGYTFLYPETIFRVNSFNRALRLLEFYSGGFLNDDGTSNTFPNNTTIEDLFPTAYGQFFNKNFFYSNILNNDIYYLFNSIDELNNDLKWYAAKANVSGSKYDYWTSDSVEVNSDLTLESANIDFYSVNSEGNNFSVQTLSKYSDIKLFQTKELNIENYSGAIYLNNPIFSRQSVLVENGGNTFANGTYIQSGGLNGRSRYVNVSSSSYDIIFSNIRTWDLRRSSGNQFYPIYRSKTRNNLAPTGEWNSLSARIPQFAQITGSGSYTLKGVISNFNSLASCINDNGTVIVSANNSFGQPRGSFTIFTGRNASFLPKQTIEGSFPSLFYPPVTNGFANSLDLSSDGSIIAVGGYQVKIYSGNLNGLGQNYTLQQTINTPFTTYNVTENNVAINGDASVLVLGTPYFNSGDGRVEIYRKTGNNSFGLQQTIIGGYGGIRWGFSTGGNTQGGFRLGDNISLSQNGRVLAIGGYLSGMGAAYVYWRNSTESLFSSRYGQWGSPSHLLGKWATSVNDDGSVVCIGGYGASILRGNPNFGSYRVLNNGTLANLTASTRVHTNGDGSKIIIGGYGQSAAIFTGNKNLTGTDASAFWSSGYALRLTGTLGSRSTFTSTNDMGTILTNSSPLSIYQQDNVIPVVTGSTLITGTSPTPESFFSNNDLVNDLNNRMYEFKKISSGQFSGPYFEGNDYIFANPEFKIDSYSGFDHLLLKGIDIVPSIISGMKLYAIDSKFLGNNIYTNTNQTHVLWKSGNSQVWNLTNNNPLIDGIFRGGFTGLITNTEPFTGFNVGIGQFRASGSGYSGSFNIFPYAKLITGARCSNTGARIWTILDKNYNYIGWKNCNSGSGTFRLSAWGTGLPMSNLLFDSVNFEVMELYKHKNDFINGTNYLLGINTGFDYSTVSGIFNLNTGQTFEFNLFNDPAITTTINYKDEGLYYGNLNNLPMNFGMDGNYFSAFTSGNISRIYINFGNRDITYRMERSGITSTLEKSSISRSIIICPIIQPEILTAPTTTTATATTTTTTPAPTNTTTTTTTPAPTNTTTTTTTTPTPGGYGY